MSAAGEQLYALLSGAVALTSLVGDRIYPVMVPNGKELPAVAYRRSNTEYVNTIHGSAPLAGDVSWELICGAKDPLQAEQVADALETIGGLEFLDRVDDFDGEAGIYANIVTVKVLNR